MKTTLTTIFTFILSCHLIMAQSNQIHVSASIKMSKDSIVNIKLMKALNGFLQSAQEANEKNEYVYELERVEAFILLDEIYGIQKSKKYKDDFYYKPYLTNLVGINDDDFLVQIVYMGNQDEKPVLRASFKIIAHKVNDDYKFSSPITQNTTEWKTVSFGQSTFHYQDSINMNNVIEFVKNSKVFDDKLGISSKTTDYYLCEDFVGVLDLIGVQYKLDYNGRQRITMVSSDSERGIKIIGNNDLHFNAFDLHDLWHNRLSLAIARKKVNKTVDEGCAYLYGGSWGMSWDEIFNRFVDKVAINNELDWVTRKENHTNFGISKAKHLYGDYVVNALIVQYLENEIGFSAVWDLLISSQYEKGNQKYYKSIEKLAGIKKADYNKWVSGLIEEERRK